MQTSFLFLCAIVSAVLHVFESAPKSAWFCFFLYFILGEDRSREGRTGWQQRANSTLAVLMIVKLRLFQFSLHRPFHKNKRNRWWWLKMQKVLIVMPWQSAKDMTGGEKHQTALARMEETRKNTWLDFRAENWLRLCISSSIPPSLPDPQPAWNEKM